jgi:bacillithiol system protein YtxJ
MWFKKEDSNKGFAWENLTSIEELNNYIDKSNEVPILLFKHSTRCPVSMMAKRRLESDWKFTPQQLLPVYLDLIAHRDISNAITEQFSVRHESPQVLLIKNGKCVYHASHEGIEVATLIF